VKKITLKNVTNWMFIILYRHLLYIFNLGFNSKNDIHIYAHNQNKLRLRISFLETRTKLLSTHELCIRKRKLINSINFKAN